MWCYEQMIWKGKGIMLKMAEVGHTFYIAWYQGTIGDVRHIQVSFAFRVDDTYTG